MNPIKFSRNIFPTFATATWRALLLSLLCLAASHPATTRAQDKPATNAVPRDPQQAFDPRSGPGAGQKFLEKFAGDWAVDKVIHRATGDPVVTKGECHQTMIHEGRFLKSEFVFHTATNTTTGTGLIGFEADAGLFTSVWIDSRSTKMSIRQSKDPFGGEEIELYNKPLATGGREARPTRTETHLVDNGRKIVHQQFAINDDKTERLSMELIMTKTSP